MEVSAALGRGHRTLTHQNLALHALVGLLCTAWLVECSAPDVIMHLQLNGSMNTWHIYVHLNHHTFIPCTYFNADVAPAMHTVLPEANCYEKQC